LLLLVEHDTDAKKSIIDALNACGTVNGWM
jgi:hypothetical protein